MPRILQKIQTRADYFFAPTSLHLDYASMAGSRRTFSDHVNRDHGTKISTPQRLKKEWIFSNCTSIDIISSKLRIAMPT